MTVKELDELTLQLKILNQRKKVAAEVVTGINKEIMQLEGRCTNYLVELERMEYKSPHGSLKRKSTWRVNMPDGDLNRQLFFNWLREKGIFDQYASVHSGSLNALYKSEWNEAIERGEGMTFSLPGIPAPTIYEETDFKPSKGE